MIAVSSRNDSAKTVSNKVDIFEGLQFPKVPTGLISSSLTLSTEAESSIASDEVESQQREQNVQVKADKRDSSLILAALYPPAEQPQCDKIIAYPELPQMNMGVNKQKQSASVQLTDPQSIQEVINNIPGSGNVQRVEAAYDDDDELKACDESSSLLIERRPQPSNNEPQFKGISASASSFPNAAVVNASAGLSWLKNARASATVAVQSMMSPDTVAQQHNPPPPYSQSYTPRTGASSSVPINNVSTTPTAPPLSTAITLASDISPVGATTIREPALGLMEELMSENRRLNDEVQSLRTALMQEQHGQSMSVDFRQSNIQMHTPAISNIGSETIGNTTAVGSKYLKCGGCRQWLAAPRDAPMVFCPHCRCINNCAYQTQAPISDNIRTIQRAAVQNPRQQLEMRGRGDDFGWLWQCMRGAFIL